MEFLLDAFDFCLIQSDSNQGTDYIVMSFLSNLKFSIANLNPQIRKPIDFDFVA